MFLRTVLTCAVLASFSVARCDEPLPFEVLVRRLGDDDFATREKASAEFLRRGEAVYAALARIAQTTKDPEVKARAADVVRRIEDARRAADELHLIGIRRPRKEGHRLAPRGDEYKWSAFCADVAKQSQAPEPNPSKRIWEWLPDEVRQDFQNAERVAAVDREQTRDKDGAPPMPTPEISGRVSTWTRALNQALAGPDFYEPEHFQALAKSPAVRDFVERREQLSPLEKRLFHRKLFDLAYPASVTPCRVEMADLTVDVHVRPGKTSINLAVCSYHSVRWVIRDPDRRVKNVIVGGYDISDVSGTNAPIAYYAHHRKENGLAGIEGYFQTSSIEQSKYPAVEEKLQRITGMKITKFHAAEFADSFEIGE